jgi:hypothetical protein
MAARVSQNEFQFIVSDGPQITSDPKTRTIIRKQAMKDVGIARKKRGNEGRVNLMQYQVLDRSTAASKQVTERNSNGSSELASLVSKTHPKCTSTSTARSATELTASWELIRFGHAPPFLPSTDHLQTWPSSVAVNPTNGYEALRAKYHFDVRDLCLLTNFNVGQSTMSAMARNPDLLATLLGGQMGSYLGFVPSRYGHKPYLTAVVDCVTAKAHSTLYPPNAKFSAIVMRMYAKALRTVQEAVSDEEASRDADLLCAVQMLSFYEVCQPCRST